MGDGRARYAGEGGDDQPHGHGRAHLRHDLLDLHVHGRDPRTVQRAVQQRLHDQRQHDAHLAAVRKPARRGEAARRNVASVVKPDVPHVLHARLGPNG